MKKYTLKVLILLFSITLIIVGCGKKEKDAIDNQNQEPKGTVIKEQVIEGLKIGNLSIVYENNISKIIANVTNTNDTVYQLRTINIKLYDEQDNLLVETKGYVGTSIKVNETRQLITEVTSDLRNAVKVEYGIDK